MLSDTIAAISTPRGKGGVAIIRISGEGAIEIAKKVFFPTYKNTITDYSPRYAIYGDIKDEKSIIDSGLCTYFAAPHSFTGENLVEIACHGGAVVTSMVLKAVLVAGARMAEAGEFTKRAFINDKMSLTEAEGLGDMLSATGEMGVRLSSRHMKGALSNKIGEITGSLVHLISSLYACIDYPEEDLEDMSEGEIIDELSRIKATAESVLATYKSGHAVTYGIGTCIAGKPNVGKSSFFNRFLNAEKAIVTSTPGTTRDIIEQTVEINGIVLRLFDTAGIRENADEDIEKIGIELAEKRILNDETELVLALFDLSRVFDEDDRRIVDFLFQNASGKCVIPVFTKCDADKLLDTSYIEEKLGHGIVISSKENIGVDELKKRIIDAFELGDIENTDGALITNARQYSTLKSGIDILENAITQIKGGMKDMGLMEAEKALSTMSEIDSKSTSEVIVNEIFSKFCVGK